MSVRAKKARRHRARTVAKTRLVVRLDNQGDHDGCVLATVEGWGAHEWAQHDQTIGGSSWETPRDMRGFAYAMPCDFPGLVAVLGAEGYALNLDCYCAPDAEASNAEAA